ncbi:hypothetical protein HSBAA_30720 [Vreelandella sulfidaeris]|uniref:Uncharacterized protein n=1 Tax=Vreelandella sulfidaeris TaxID=115553 RepID=A0A455U6M6_9GAMM|nr:hypothetical protein HSBAA_30720 [Halomonas sulfidaeris]
MKLKTPLIVTAAAVGLAFGSYFANGDRYLAYFDSQIKTCWHTAHRTVNESDSLRLIRAGKRFTDSGMRVDLTYNIKDSRGLTRPSYIHCTFSRRAPSHVF